MNRGAGKTTKQIKALPQGGLFVWCNERIEYPLRLCRNLGRDDVVVVKPSWVIHGFWRGQQFPAVACDHALFNFLSAREAWKFCDEWDGLTSRVRVV